MRRKLKWELELKSTHLRFGRTERAHFPNAPVIESGSFPTIALFLFKSGLPKRRKFGFIDFVKPPKLKAMNAGAAVAIPWYETEQDYVAVAAMLPLSERQDPLAHDAFMSKMKHHELELRSQGAIPVRVPIDAVTLKGWCDANNLPVCRQSIVEYGMICATLILKRDARHN